MKLKKDLLIHNFKTTFARIRLFALDEVERHENEDDGDGDVDDAQLDRRRGAVLQRLESTRGRVLQVGVPLSSGSGSGVGVGPLGRRVPGSLPISGLLR